MGISRFCQQGASVSKSDVACLILASLIAYQPSAALAQQASDDTTSTATVSETTEAPLAPYGSTPAKPKKWKFATIGYGWFAGAKGETDIIGPVPPVDLDLSFGDALKDLKFAFMGAAEARHDRIVILGDLVFIHLKAHDGIGIRDPDFLKATLDLRTSELTLIGGYRVVNHGPSRSICWPAAE